MYSASLSVGARMYESRRVFGLFVREPVSVGLKFPVPGVQQGWICPVWTDLTCGEIV